MKLLVVGVALLGLVSMPALADVRDTDSVRQLSLAQTGPTLSMQRDDWLIGSEKLRQDKAVIYYLMSSARRALTFSVYINKAPTCAAPAACLDIALTNPVYKDAQDLARLEVGQFNVAHFSVDKPAGTPGAQTNVLAMAFVEGQWFDIHISSYARTKPEVGPLLEVLKTIMVK